MIKRGVVSAPERAWREVKAFLATGRHTMALAAVRRAGGARDAAQAALRALAEADALMGLVRYGDGLRVIARAMGRRPVQTDLVARLRITRGRLLWLTGSGDRGRAELRKAAAEVTTTLTRARLHEVQGFLAWKQPQLEIARRHLHLARALYAKARSPKGIMRVHETEGGLLRDAGRFREALALHDRRARFAAVGGLENGVAAAKRDRGDLLAYLGRWHEARADLDVAAETFRRLNNPREAVQTGLKRVMVDLAQGDLVSARASLARAKDPGGVASIGPRRLAEDLLLLSDLDLALGDAPAAHREAGEALRLFTLAKDAEGQCRGHVRRAHALIELERAGEGAREARRALRAAPRTRTDLRVLAEIALGRALLRTEREQARFAFERALAHVEKRPGLAPVVALGRALAAGGGLRDPEVRAAIARLEAWGDRRILSYCLRDARQLSGESPGKVSAAAAGTPRPARQADETLGREDSQLEIPPWQATGLVRDSGTAALDAAASLAGEGEWHERWAAAMRDIAPVLPWSRAILVSPQACSWELRQDRESPRELAEDDPSRVLAGGLDGPVVVDLKSQPASRDHPVRALHGLASAILAPVDSDGSVLYLDTREGQPTHGERELCLLARLARLIGAHGPQPGPVRREAAAARGFPEIVGRCAAMQSVFRDIERVASSDITVHILGETGTGKEQVAQAIHRRSRRGSGRFVPVNASSLSDERLGSELFGHVKGAFTGAVATQDGFVAAAEGGTLFIDEVTDLDLRVQAKLLRFLQEREYSRMGELALRRADIRLLTASNTSLADRVASGQLREDLMYRLNTSQLELPPLRERGQDVILLARHFLRAWAAVESRPVPTLSREAARALSRFGWPGNVRELESEMRRLVVFASGDRVRAEDLAAHIARATCEETCSLKDAVQRFEREHIREALARHEQNRTHTARFLGITRQALLGKIQCLGL